MFIMMTDTLVGERAVACRFGGSRVLSRALAARGPVVDRGASMLEASSRGQCGHANEPRSRLQNREKLDLCLWSEVSLQTRSSQSERILLKNRSINYNKVDLAFSPLDTCHADVTAQLTSGGVRPVGRGRGGGFGLVQPLDGAYGAG